MNPEEMISVEEKKVHQGLIRIFEISGHAYSFELISQIAHKGVIPQGCPLSKDHFVA